MRYSQLEENMETNSTQRIVTRFAPSPTGFMHIGGIRTALFAWLYARKNHGTFILRIEDTDKEREVPGSVAHIMEALRWLGLDWDYGPDKPGAFGACVQSERLGTYKSAALRLIEKGYAYPDPYSPEEVARFRELAQAEKRPFLFRDHRPATFMEWDGTRPLRLRVPEIKRYIWNDAVRGELTAGEEALDDFILMKADGYPTYNFAHIIDDMQMNVTHIMRGDEFIASTPKFLSLYDALEITPPMFVSLPPILRDDKTKKLGKRDGAKDVLDYRNEGYLADAMVNFLAFIGWHPGTDQEVFTREELISAFSLEGIQTHGAIANDDKLRWFQEEHMKQKDDAMYRALVMGAAPDKEDAMWHRITPLIRERVALKSEFDAQTTSGEYAYFFASPTYAALMLPNRNASPEVTKAHLEQIAILLASSTFADTESVKSLLWDYATEKGRGDVLWPFRVALSGREKSPDPFTLSVILGKDEVLRRVQSAIALLT